MSKTSVSACVVFGTEESADGYIRAYEIGTTLHSVCGGVGGQVEGSKLVLLILVAFIRLRDIISKIEQELQRDQVTSRDRIKCIYHDLGRTLGAEQKTMRYVARFFRDGPKMQSAGIVDNSRQAVDYDFRRAKHLVGVLGEALVDTKFSSAPIKPQLQKQSSIGGTTFSYAFTTKTHWSI